MFNYKMLAEWYSVSLRARCAAHSISGAAGQKPQSTLLTSPPFHCVSSVKFITLFAYQILLTRKKEFRSSYC